MAGSSIGGMNRLFDEVHQLSRTVDTRDNNGGKPPAKAVVMTPENANDYRSQVLSAAGVGLMADHSA